MRNPFQTASPTTERENTAASENRTNPFVRPTQVVEAEPEVDHAPLLGNKLELTGATTVLGDPAAHTPAIEPAPSADKNCLFLEGVAGGVGVTTLARMCSERVIDTGTIPAPEGASKVLVTSVSAPALARAEQMRSLDTNNHFLAVVLVHHRRSDDVSKQTKQRAKRVARMFPKAFEVSYEPTWSDLDVTTKHEPSWKHRRRMNHLVKRLNSWAQHVAPDNEQQDQETTHDHA